ncbi:ATP-binding protein [Niveispirillum irakense]|uniref:ATP-binding protein n=1 Tax=Niveispirillum irakense TaxID=34011 RepID=UPI000687AD0E|nr:ATP-binding protein [Niveispirillum irakense]
MRFFHERPFVALVAALAILWAGLAAFLVSERERTLRLAQHDLVNLSLTLEEQTFWLFSAVEQLLQTVKADAEGTGVPADLTSLLARQSLPPGFALEVTLFDDAGTPVASSRPGIIGAQALRHFLIQPEVARHVERDLHDILIAPPVREGEDGRWILPVSIRINRIGANGDVTFGGIALVTVDPFYVSSFRHQLNLGRDGALAIIGTDGIVRTRAGPSQRGQIGVDTLALPTMEQARRQPDGTLQREGPHNRLIAAYRTVHHYPLIALVCRSEKESLMPWRQLAFWTIGVGLLCSFIFGVFFFLLCQEGRRGKAQARDLAEANRRLRLAEQVARIGHWRINLKEQTVFWSDEIYRIHGVDRQSFTPTYENVTKVYEKEDQDKLAMLMRAAMADGGSYEAPLRVRRPDGKRCTIIARGMVEFSEAGEPVALFGVVSDVTDAAIQEEALRQARMEAEKAAHAKSDFLATVSHELRTPLNAVIGFADLLLTADLPEQERRHYIRLQAEAGRTLLAVINDVLDFSKIEAGRLELEELPADIVGLLQTCADLVRPMAAEKRLALSLDIAPDLPPWLMLDPTRLRQIVLNLLNNAVKFTERGHVRLSAGIKMPAEGPALLRIAVEDSGIGVVPERLCTLFEPFHQADASTARRYGGTGLGLAICRRLLGLMGGEIGVDSVPGRGSLFWVEIPLRPAAPPAHAPEPPLPAVDQAVAQGRSLRILVAEDLPVNQLLVRAILERAGHMVVMVSDGDGAVAAVQTGDFDLVLMDVQMPGMDGLEATRCIRALPPPAGHIPIVALTANALPAEVERCRQAGMNDHIAKPIEAAHLVAVLARWSQRLGASATGETENTVAPAPSTETDQESPLPPVVLEDMLVQLEELMGADALQAMLAEVSETLKSRVAHLRQEEMGLDQIGTNAHAIISLAGNFGLMEMSASAKALEEACEDNRPLAEIAQRLDELVRAADRGLAALADYLPALAARA